MGRRGCGEMRRMGGGVGGGEGIEVDRCKGSRRDEGVEKGLKEREKEWQKEDEGREMVK